MSWPAEAQLCKRDQTPAAHVIKPTIGSGVPIGTFLRHLQLFRMTIQQDPSENDPWWFAPLLYAGAAVVFAAFVLA